jgi:catechol 2,3-dioxygenase-like lactoylglutathione lyase family enzyme
MAKIESELIVRRIIMRPSGMRGLRHLALRVKNLDACVAFYRDLLGMSVEWQPDPDNVYLTTGVDNLALHRAPEDMPPGYALDHLGFILQSPAAVDEWFLFFEQENVKIKAKPKTHRDGAKSFYCEDPDGNLVQMIYHPPLSR